MVSRCVITVALMVLVVKCALGTTLSSRLIPRFSDEMGALRVLKGGGGSGSPPARRSLGYYRMLMNNDVQRQKLKLGPKYQYLFPSEGSNTKSLGNDFGWLHYTWIDIGTPKISFLVALDAGSDLLWVPCDCIQCAPLSASYYNSLDRNLNQYSPSGSTTSKHLTCSHQLCELGPNCQSPKQQCPYTVNYYSQDTSTSGFLVEDTFHLASGSGGSSNLSVQARVVIGCGRKQSGGYLDGVAPDGLLGLGFGDISVPSFLAKAGLVQNSFSLCFNDNGSGRIYFGDQGPADQRSTPFLASDGKYIKYTVAVKTCCVGTSCFDNTNFKALVDSGTSFTFLPKDVYERVVKEFDRQINATRADYEGSPWNYCYKTSSQMMPTTPSVALKFSVNNSFVIHNPFFIVNNDQGMDGFCLAIQPADEDIATIGQNFMTGYRMVFDRENLKLGWSRSNCEDHSDGKGMPLTPSKNNSSPKPLPTTEQQRAPSGHAVAPAVAGRTPAKPSAAPTRLVPSHLRLAEFVLLSLLVLHPLPALCI